MSFVVILILGLIAALCAFIGYRFLKSFSWFLGWLRGTFGLLFIGLSCAFAVGLVDVMSYEPLLADKSIATLSLTKLEEQKYQATFVKVLEGEKQTFEIKGDQWQVDARIYRWGDALALLGVKPSYRLERIAGRYFSLEQERNSERSVFKLQPSDGWFDTWQWVNDNKNWVPAVDASYGSAIYLPMVDGALFEILLSNKGLTAKPLNGIAQKAIDDWK